MRVFRERSGALVRLTLVLVALALPLAGVQAAPSDAVYQGSEPCVTCHVAQSEEWLGSTHALVNVVGHEGVTCTDCHGPYDQGHPGAATMAVDSDSCICEVCHAETEHQWADSAHAAADIQCIGCHEVHSQELRQTRDVLCVSCHPGSPADALHATHQPTGVICTDCHFSPIEQKEGSELRPVAGDQTIANHTLNPDTSTACIICHSSPLGGVDGNTGQIQPVMSVNETKWTELTLELDETRSANRQLQVLPFVTLGVGLGIGGVMGAIVVLGVGLMCQRRDRG